MKALVGTTAVLMVVLAITRPNISQALTTRDYVTDGLMCIHSHEGSWTSNTGNGYYGGLQMDWGFMHTYGSEFMAKWGTADRWPIWAQLVAAKRAYYGYAHYKARYFGPWPNTRRECGI